MCVCFTMGFLFSKRTRVKESGDEVDALLAEYEEKERGRDSMSNDEFMQEMFIRDQQELRKLRHENKLRDDMISRLRRQLNKCHIKF